MDLGIAKRTDIWYNIVCVNAHNKKYFKYGQDFSPAVTENVFRGRTVQVQTEGGNKNVGYFY